jgi:hypothetical protein
MHNRLTHVSCKTVAMMAKLELQRNSEKAEDYLQQN